jgi:beta-lactamase class A
VSPASVMKIQVALAVEVAISRGELDAAAPRQLSPERRTPGPVGVSLLHDTVTMSVRDLVVQMLTVSDNVATDELIALVGLDAINRLTRELRLEQTLVVADLRTMLGEIARDAGFEDFGRLVAAELDASPVHAQEIARRIAQSGPLDPTRGTRTTPRETVHLLRAIWTGDAGPADACARVRATMAHQLVRARIASGFDPSTTVAAKSGGLLGVVRNEAGVVRLPDGFGAAVAVFTRRMPNDEVDPVAIDRSIGATARGLVDALRAKR